jgi:hypothetical protein
MHLSEFAVTCRRIWQRTAVREASRAHAHGSPVSGEGEIGCLFDEIQNLVESIERSAMNG